MKKFKFLLTFLFLLILFGCSEKEKQYSKLSNEQMKEQIQTLINAKYFESSIYFKMKSEEMNSEITPLLKMKNLVTKEGVVSSVEYESSLIKSFNITSFKLVVDEPKQLIYLFSDENWIKIDNSSILEEPVLNNQPVFDINKIVNNMLLEFNNLEYIKTEQYDDKTLQHYKVKINVLDAIKEIYNIINKESENKLPDFNSILEEFQINNIVMLSEEIEIDIYFDVDTKMIYKVEVDFIRIMDFVLSHKDKFENQLPKDFDLNQLRNYLKNFIIGMNFDNINAYDTIEISEDAKNATDISMEELMRLISNKPIFDVNKPEITLNDSSSIQIYEGEEYQEFGAVAYDIQDGDLSCRIEIESNVNTNQIGNYTVKYTVLDNDGNHVSKERIVNVIEIDRQAPVITINGDSEINLNLKDTYVEYGATAFDNVDGDISSSIKIYHDVSTSVEGTYIVKYMVTDSSNNTSFVTRTVHVTPIKYLSKNDLKFIYNDTIMHPTEPIIYFLDSINKSLLEYNLNTKEMKSVSFSLYPERMTFSNNKIYVTLLKGKHSHYWWKDEQQGAYAVINANDFNDVTIYDIEIDPFDIVVDNNGFVYIPSGSGQHSILNVYNSEGIFVAQENVYEKSYIEFNAVLNKAYLVDPYTSPADTASFTYDLETNETRLYDSPHHGDYEINKQIFISPDGKYLFNSSGNIFTCSPGRDMNYYARLKHEYTDIAFNLSDNEFYLIEDNYIHIYRYDYLKYYNLTYKKSIKIDANASNMFYRDNLFYVLEKELLKTSVKTFDLSEN